MVLWLRSGGAWRQTNGGGGHAGRRERANAPAPMIEAGKATHEQRCGGFVIVPVPIVLGTYQVDDR